MDPIIKRPKPTNVARKNSMHWNNAEKELIESLRGAEFSTGLDLLVIASWGDWTVTQSYPIGGTKEGASSGRRNGVGKGKSFEAAWKKCQAALNEQ